MLQLPLALKPGERFKVKSAMGIFGADVIEDWPPAVIVHGLAQARLALSAGRPLTLLSAPGAGAYAGCGWWRALVHRVRDEFPAVAAADILDCAESSGQAMAALRSGQRCLVLWATAPGWDAVAAIAARQGGAVMQAAPRSLDLAQRGAERRLHDWLRLRTA